MARSNSERMAEANLEALRNNPSPGSGLVVGVTGVGELVHVYWIMTGGENSSRSGFVPKGDVVRAVMLDENGSAETGLTLYDALRIQRSGRRVTHIVSSGDQTDAVYDFLSQASDKPADQAFDEAMHTQRAEQNKPIYTPRITAITKNVGWRSLISVIRQDPWGEPVYQLTPIEELPGPCLGFCVHTTMGTHSLGSKKDPYLLPVGEDLESTVDMYLENLEPNGLEALAVKSVDLHTGSVRYRVSNADE